MSMYSVLNNTLSEYAYFYILKNITSYTILLVFKIAESLQCMLNRNSVFADWTKWKGSTSQWKYDA